MTNTIPASLLNSLLTFAVLDMKTKESKRRTYLLIAILIAAAILRFYKIDQPFIDGSDWRQSDTATIADNFYQGNWNILYPEISWNGPGHNYVGYEFQTVTYIAAFLYRLVGHHDWVARSVAVVFGLWGIFAFYQLVRRVWSDKHALVSAAVLAILPGQVYVDRSFLPDPVMLSLVITSVWLLVVYVQTAHLRDLVLASLAGIFGFLTKIPGLIVGIPMLYAVVTILSQKQRLRSKQLVLIGAAAVVTLIPVIAYYLWAIHISQTYPPYYIAAGEYWVWKYGLRHFLAAKYFLPKLYFHLGWFWTKPLILLVILGLVVRPLQFEHGFPPEQSLRNHTENYADKAPWLFHWWFLAFGIYYLIAAQGLVNNPTNFNLINPAAAALSGSALMTIAAFVKRIAGSPGALATIAVVLVIIAGFGHRALEKLVLRPWVENDYKLGLSLNQISQPNDLVITAASTPGDTVAIYYSQRRGWTFPPVYAWSSALARMDDNQGIGLLKELSSKGADWFGMVDYQRSQLSKTNPKLIEYMERTFERYQETPKFVIYRIPSQQ